MSDPRLRISEIFASIQGEGIWTGVPSLFIRTSGCNLRCRWCDTPYASWQPEGPVMPIDDIVDRVQAMRGAVSHAVLTGGEPMLFDPIEALAQRLAALGFTITIETAGTVFRELPCDLMSISPKLANSTPGAEAGSGWSVRHEATRLQTEILSRLIERYSVQLKFVVNPEAGDDLSEIESLLASIAPVAPEQILLMPEGTDVETLRRRAKLLVQPCMARGWRLTQRMHVELFGNTKGT